MNTVYLTEANAKTYRRAVAVLKPSRAAMKARFAEAEARTDAAKKIVAEMLATTGKNAETLYREACAARTEFDSKLTKEIRVVLLGLYRRG